MRAAAVAALVSAALACGCGGDDEAGPPNRIAPVGEAAAGGGSGQAPRGSSTGASSGSGAAGSGSTGVPRLTLAQLAGQHVVFPFAGPAVPAALERRIRRGEVAGVVLFARNVGPPAQVRALTARLQRIPRPAGLRAPLLVAIDQEGGPVRRLPGAPTRTPQQLAGAGSAGLARAQGRATARTLRAAGVNVDFAPVLDVPRPGGAIAREGRGLGTTPAAVGRVGVAFARGLQDGGVAASAKHFPGFGAAALNTDDGVATIGLPAATLRRVDGAPFAAAVQAGVRTVMVASARYPALSAMPASLSARVVRGELRERLGFRGVTVTDDLETPAFAAYGGAPGAAVRAARAGMDLLLCAQSNDGAARTAAAVESALRRGALSRRDLEAGLERVLALRESVQ